MGTKVFTFQEENTEAEELSSATLTNAPNAPLPDHFVICSSHKQQQIGTHNTETIYVLYEDSSFTRPWFSIGFWKLTLDYVLMVNIRYDRWYDLGQVTREAFLFWIHICVEVDTINGTLRASINGGNVTTVEKVKGLAPAQKLHMRLGVGHDNRDNNLYQYFGSVSNINIFTIQTGVKESHLLLTTRSACNQIKNTFFQSWIDSRWKVIGKGTHEEELNEKVFCSKSTALNFRIPLQWNKHEATKECRKYGEHANLSKPPLLDRNDTTDVDMKKIYGENYTQCKYYWTHFTDEYEEDCFVDETSNKSRKYISNTINWSRSEPNGGRRENYIVIRPQKTFDDMDWEKEVCVSCEVEKSTKFSLRGVCNNSYFETEYYPTICGGYIGFIGNLIMIW